jgi:hypothetical protein
MIDIAITEVLDKLPVVELENSLATFLKPMLDKLPDKRLQGVVPLAVRGIVGSETPIVTQMAQTVARTESGVWAAALTMLPLLGGVHSVQDPERSALGQFY